MASWLPETLFEIVGQGPAPSKDYYQLLITRTQASASHGFLSLLTPFPARPGLAMRPAPGKQPPWPAGSAASQLTARDLPSSPLLGGLRVGSLPESGSSLANLPCLPQPNADRFPSYLPASYPLRSLRAPEKNRRPCLRASSPQRGKEGKKDSAKCPKEEPAGGERDGLFQGRT